MVFLRSLESDKGLCWRIGVVAESLDVFNNEISAYEEQQPSFTSFGWMGVMWDGGSRGGRETERGDGPVDSDLVSETEVGAEAKPSP